MSKKGIRLASLSHKYFMAAAGVFLMLFLIAHLSTNLLLIIGDEGAKFDEAVEFLTTNPFIRVVEVFLFGGFILHILLGFVIEWHNKKSRPVGYKVSTKSQTSGFSRFMIHTGVVIFIFLIIHLYHFFFVKVGLVDVYAGAESKHDFFPMVREMLQNPLVSVFYAVSVVILGFHLNHAFQSAFQSFGLNHNKYTPAIKIIGTLYAIVISAGFFVIPVYFMFFYS